MAPVALELWYRRRRKAQVAVIAGGEHDQRSITQVRRCAHLSVSIRGAHLRHGDIYEARVPVRLLRGARERRMAAVRGNREQTCQASDAQPSCRAVGECRYRVWLRFGL